MHSFQNLWQHSCFVFFLFWRSQRQSQRRTLPFWTLSWKEVIWILWSSCGFEWEKVSRFLWVFVFSMQHYKRAAAVILLFQHRCDFIPGHWRLPDVGHWSFKIRRHQALGMEMFFTVNSSRHLWVWLIWICFTSSRFTETAAAPSVSSFSSLITSRSITCLSQVSPQWTCCSRWVWTKWEKTILTTWLVTFWSVLYSSVYDF